MKRWGALLAIASIGIIAGLPAAQAQSGGALGPVVVLAHRGASFDAPEHTYNAYSLAIEYDTDFIECDLQISADDVLVCVHDETVDRTSNGTGSVRDMTLAQLRELDWGSWYNGANPTKAKPEYVGAELVTFEAQIDCYLAVNPNIRFHVETKAPSLYNNQMEPLLVDLLTRKGLLSTGNNDIQTSQVIIQSFERESLQAIKQLAPTLPTAYLWSVPPDDVLTGAMPDGVDAAAPNFLHLLSDPTFVQRAHANGHEVQPYTVDDPNQMRVLLEMGVDGIFTNRPDLLRAEIDALGIGVPAEERGNPESVDPACPRTAAVADPVPLTTTVVPAPADSLAESETLPATGSSIPAGWIALLLGAGILALPLFRRGDNLPRH